MIEVILNMILWDKYHEVQIQWRSPQSYVCLNKPSVTPASTRPVFVLGRSATGTGGSCLMCKWWYERWIFSPSALLWDQDQAEKKWNKQTLQSKCCPVVKGMPSEVSYFKRHQLINMLVKKLWFEFPMAVGYCVALWPDIAQWMSPPKKPPNFQVVRTSTAKPPKSTFSISSQVRRQNWPTAIYLNSNILLKGI